jgi:hypothetical protein
MGIPAGDPGEDGSYPEGTLYRKVADRLAGLRDAVRKQEDEREKSGEERKGDNAGRD